MRYGNTTYPTLTSRNPRNLPPMESAGVQSNPQADQLRQAEKARQVWQSPEPSKQGSFSEKLGGYWGHRPALSRNPGTFPRVPTGQTSGPAREQRNQTIIVSFLESLDGHFASTPGSNPAGDGLETPIAAPKNFLNPSPLVANSPTASSALQTAATAASPLVEDFTGPTQQRIAAADIPIFFTLNETNPFANPLFPLPSFPTAVISADISSRLAFGKLEFVRSLAAKGLTRQYLRITSAGLEDAEHLVAGVKHSTNEFAGHLKPPVEFSSRSAEKAEQREASQRLEQRALDLALAQRAATLFGLPTDRAAVVSQLPGLPSIQLPNAEFSGFVSRNNEGALLLSQSRLAAEDLRQTVTDQPTEEGVALLQQIDESVGRLENALLRNLLVQFEFAPLSDAQFQSVILPLLNQSLPAGSSLPDLQSSAARFFQSPVQTRQDGTFSQDAQTLVAVLTFGSDANASLFQQFFTVPANTAGPAVQSAAFAAVADTFLSTPVATSIPSVTPSGLDLDATFARSPVESQQALAPDLRAFRAFAAAAERLAESSSTEGPVSLSAVRDLEIGAQRLAQVESAFEPGGRLANLRETTPNAEVRQFLDAFQTNVTASRAFFDQTSQTLSTRPVELANLTDPDSIETRFLALLDNQLPETSRPILSSSPAITVADLQTALSQLRPETRTILIEGVQAFVEFTAAFSQVTNASEVSAVLTLSDLQNQSIANQRLAQLDANFQQSAALSNLRQETQNNDLQQFLDELQTRVEANRDLLIETNAASRRQRIDLGQSEFDRSAVDERFQDFLINKAGLEAEAAQRIANRELSDAQFVQRRDRASEVDAPSERAVGETVEPEELDIEDPPREVEPQPDDRVTVPVEDSEQDLRFVDTGVDRRDLERLQRLEQGADLTNEERLAAERAAENILFRILGQEPVTPIDDTRVQLANLAARNEIPVRFANDLASRDLSDPRDREFVENAIELTRQNEPNLAQRLSELYFNGQLQQGVGLTTESVRVMMDEALQAPYIYKIGDQYRSVMT